MDSATSTSAQAAEPDVRPAGGRRVAAWLAGLLLLGLSAVAACRAANTDAV